ncbi:MAG TPA: hypothetical protein VES89_07575, partial [Candidatus Competibacteraceae bacterium]|nr:hypothetical protein [Candidatus Competibacteraceae bacterium]
VPEMYALFPMIATQSASPSGHIRLSAVKNHLHDYLIHSRLRDHLLAHLMRPNENAGGGIVDCVSAMDDSKGLIQLKLFLFRYAIFTKIVGFFSGSP